MTLVGPNVAVASMSDAALVADVRTGADGAFEELYRRHHRGVGALVHRLVRDAGRAEDVTQEAFVSALRGIRSTERVIVFKPWIYEIARNAAIDNRRRTARSQEVSMDAAALRPADRGWLVGLRPPEAEVLDRERLRQIYGALGELPENQERIILLRELEGLSYREIAARLGLSQSAVEAALFRARRHLQTAYIELDSGRRCAQMRATAARLAEGVGAPRDRQRLQRHTRRCADCRRHARALGVGTADDRLTRRVGALAPLAALARRRGASAPADDHGSYVGTLLSGVDPALALPVKAVALIAAAALVGGGGATLAGIGPLAPRAPVPLQAPTLGAPLPPVPHAAPNADNRAARSAPAPRNRVTTPTVNPRPEARPAEGLRLTPALPDLTAPSKRKLGEVGRQTTHLMPEAVKRPLSQVRIPAPQELSVDPVGSASKTLQSVVQTLPGTVEGVQPAPAP